jgi:hypothetical protein
MSIDICAQAEFSMFFLSLFPGARAVHIFPITASGQAMSGMTELRVVPFEDRVRVVPALQR